MKTERPVPATVVLELRDPESPADEFISLSTTMYQAGLIFEEPRELRRSPDSPGRLELICTFVDSVAMRRWRKDPLVLRCFGEDFAEKLGSPPKAVRHRDVILDVDDVRTCSCKKHGSLLLMGHIPDRTGPLVCGDCLAAVPNYLLPDELGAERWARVYTSVWEIWLASDTLEKWATNELCDYHGELNTQGRKLARKASKHFGAPVYYVLFVEEPYDQETCPNCSRKGRESPWRSPARICKRCRIAFDFE